MTIPIPMASVVMALDGSARRLAGMHPASRTSISEGFLRKVYPDALSIPADVTRGGVFTPNLEALLALKPDLVVTWSEPIDSVQALERAGLSVLTLQNDPSTLSEHFANLDKLGRALGLEARVRAVQDDIDRTGRIVHESLGGVSVRPRTLYLRQSKTALSASGSRTFQDFWIRLAGGHNVAGSLTGHQAQTTFEQLIAWDPEIVLLGTFDAAEPADVLAHAALANVSAIRSQRVYKVPHGGYRWDPASHESGLMLMWAAAVIQPDRFRPDLRLEMRRAYEHLYGYRLNDDEIDEILQLRGNSTAPGYRARFGR